MPRTAPASLDLLEGATRSITVTRTMSAQPEAIFDRLADAASWERWFPGMRRCRWLTPAPHGVGSSRQVRVGPLEVDERFIVWDRPHRWGFTFLRTNLPLARAGVEVVDLRAVDEVRTEVSYTMALELPGLLRLPSAAIGPPISRALAAGLASLERDLRAHPRSG